MFTLAGIVIRDFFLKSSRKKHWRHKMVLSFVLGLLLFFGKSLMFPQVKDEFAIAFVAVLVGLIGDMLFLTFLNKPFKFFELMKGMKELSKDEDEKKK